MSKTPTHIAVVVPSLTLAGAEKVAQTLAREFAHTTKVTVVTMEPRIDPHQLQALPVLPWADRVPAGCHQVHLASTGAGLFRLAPLVVRFAALARRERFDVVYSFLTWTNVLVAAAKLFGGRYRHIASEHAMAESLRSDGGQLASLASSLPLVYRRPDWIVVVSDAVRDSLSKAGVLPRPDRVATIPNPVDGAEIRRLADAPLEVPMAPDQGTILVCVARLHEQKDHVTLLRAMTQLPTSYHLYVVGEGPLSQELGEVIDHFGLEDQVTLVGTLPNPYPLMRRADLVVLPSKEEGFGLVAAEAAALGVPFLGSDAGGLAEVCALLGHRTFSVGDFHALAKAVLELAPHRWVSPDAATQVDRLFGPAEIAARYLRLGERADRVHRRPRPTRAGRLRT